jgi:hypothetical protein
LRERWAPLIHVDRTLGKLAVKKFLLTVVIVIGTALTSTVEARVRSLEIELASIDGWEITARERVSTVSCFAEKSKGDTDIILIANDKEIYQGGLWYLSVTFHNVRLKPGIEEVEAQLSLNRRVLAVGKAFSVGDTVRGIRTNRYTRFEFPALDSLIVDLETPSSIDIQAEGIEAIKLESLSTIIKALKKCHKDSSIPSFWKDAEEKCN